MNLWRRATPAREVDWRMAADPADLREYDAFGPWIDDVRSEATMPRAFRPFYAEFSDAAFLLKIPRNIDRAAARPGQDLYAAVLAVSERGVCLLRHVDGEVTREDAGWTKVVACCTYTNLLLARWTLLLSSGSAIDVSHNSVGSAMMAKVTDFVRAHTTAPEDPRGQPDLPAVAVPQDYSSSKLAELKRTFPAPVVAIHVEQKNRLCRGSGMRPSLSTGVMIVDTPRELVLVTGGEPTRPIFSPNYATNVVVVPYSRLDDYALVAPAMRKGRVPFRVEPFHELRLRAGAQVIEQPCLDEPAPAVAALDGRGIPRAGEQGSAGLR